MVLISRGRVRTCVCSVTVKADHRQITCKASVLGPALSHVVAPLHRLRGYAPSLHDSVGLHFPDEGALKRVPELCEDLNYYPPDVCAVHPVEGLHRQVKVAPVLPVQCGVEDPAPQRPPPPCFKEVSCEHLPSSPLLGVLVYRGLLVFSEKGPFFSDHLDAGFPCEGSDAWPES